MKENTPLSHEVVCFQNQMLDFETSKSNSDVLISKFKFVKNYCLAVSHNVLYYQALPITRYQVRLYVNNYFE